MIVDISTKIISISFFLQVNTLERKNIEHTETKS